MALTTRKLMNDYEILAKEPSDSHSYLKDRCLMIPQIEQNFFNECLGYDFYKALLLDMNEFEYVYFRKDKVYTVGTFVMDDKFCIFRVIQKTDGTQITSNEAYFEKTTKFNNSNYQTLWDEYLSLIIAFSVKGGSLEYRWVKDSSMGLHIPYEEGRSKPVDIKALEKLKGSTFDDVDMITRNMLMFIKRNQASYALAQIPDTEEEIKEVNRSKNYGFTGLDDEYEYEYW